MVFLDEIAFTKRSLLTKTWISRGKHIAVDQSEVYKGFRTAIAAVSREKGLVLMTSEEKVTSQENFIPFLKKLSRKMRSCPFYLFMDKLSVHTAKDVKKEYIKFNITPIFNIAASPEFNPIETVFAHVKAGFKRARLNALANMREFDLDEEVKKSTSTL